MTDLEDVTSQQGSELETEDDDQLEVPVESEENDLEEGSPDSGIEQTQPEAQMAEDVTSDVELNDTVLFKGDTEEPEGVIELEDTVPMEEIPSTRAVATIPQLPYPPGLMPQMVYVTPAAQGLFSPATGPVMPPLPPLTTPTLQVVMTPRETQGTSGTDAAEHVPVARPVTKNRSTRFKGVKSRSDPQAVSTPLTRESRSKSPRNERSKRKAASLGVVKNIRMYENEEFDNDYEPGLEDVPELVDNSSDEEVPDINYSSEEDYYDELDELQRQEDRNAKASQFSGKGKHAKGNGRKGRSTQRRNEPNIKHNEKSNRKYQAKSKRWDRSPSYGTAYKKQARSTRSVPSNETMSERARMFQRLYRNNSMDGAQYAQYRYRLGRNPNPQPQRRGFGRGNSSYENGGPTGCGHGNGPWEDHRSRGDMEIASSGRTPAEIRAAMLRQRCAQRTARRGSPRRHLRMKVDKYDGQGVEWHDYHAQFEAIADWNQWDEDEKRQQLVAALKGDALAVYGDNSRAGYYELCVLLENRFAPGDRQTAYRNKFEDFEYTPDMTPESYGQELVRLARKAYPSIPRDELDPVIIARYCGGITPEGAKFHVQLARPHTLWEAMTVFAAYQAIKSSSLKKAKKPAVNTVQTKAPNGNAKPATGTGTGPTPAVEAAVRDLVAQQTKMMQSWMDKQTRELKQLQQNFSQMPTNAGTQSGSAAAPSGHVPDMTASGTGTGPTEGAQRPPMICHYCRKAGHGWVKCRARVKDAPDWKPEGWKPRAASVNEVAAAVPQTDLSAQTPAWEPPGAVENVAMVTPEAEEKHLN